MKRRMILILLVLLSSVLSFRAAGATQEDCSAANTLIAFEGQNEAGETAIFTVASDGSHLQPLTDFYKYYNQGPVWSPSGEEIAYSHGFSLTVVNADGTNERTLAENPPGVQSPAWSPNGSQIVVQNVTDRSLDVIPTDGSDKRVLVTESSPDPDWSPDGKQILYGSSSGLVVIDPSQSGVEPQLVHSGTNGQWSPDGTQILFLDYYDGGSKLHIMDADGTNVQLVADISGPFTLSPDATQVAYIDANDTGTTDLFVRDLQTGEITQITDTPDINELTLDWQPCPDITLENAPAVVFNPTTNSQPTEVAANPASADSLAVTDAQLVDVPVVEGLVMTLWEDWIIWRPDDFSDLTEAFAAYQQYQASVGLNPTTDSSVINGLQFQAWYKITERGGVASMTALVLPLSDLKSQLGAAVTTDDMVTAVSFNKLLNIELNGREITVGNNPQSPSQGVATFIFPEQNLAAIVFQSLPAEFREPNLMLLTLMLTSLRPAGEPLPLDEFTAFTGQPLPEGIQPPVASDTATENGSGEATTVPAGNQTCQISAAQNVNLRSGPGTSFDRAGSLAGGTQIAADGQATGSDGNVWWRLSDGTWVRSDVVDEVGSCDTLPTVTP